MPPRDPLHADDLRDAARKTPGEKLAEALELMDAGLRLKREALRSAHPEMTEEELQVEFERWLFADA